MSIENDYIKHALQIIRVSNGLRNDANAQMRALAVRIRKIFADEDVATLSFPKLRKLIREADDIAFEFFKELQGKQSDAVAELVAIEAQWALDTGNYTQAASETAIARSAANLTIAGNTVQEQIDGLYNGLRMNLVQQVRLGAASNQTDREIIQRVVGTGSDMAGGIMQRTQAAMNAVIEAQLQAAADAGRRAAMAANGINALKYHAILDSKVCPSCGERDGMFYTIDGDPIAHDIPYLPIPLHLWCRCIYIPQDIPAGYMLKIKPSSSFSDFLDKLSQDEQNGILGVGRAQMWRDGTISLNDLIGQNGMAMTLGELRDSISN